MNNQAFNSPLLQEIWDKLKKDASQSHINAFMLFTLLDNRSSLPDFLSDLNVYLAEDALTIATI